MNEKNSRSNEWSMTVNSDLIGGGLLTAVAAVALSLARGATFNVWIFPRVTAIALLFLGAGLFIKGCLAPDRRELFADPSSAARVLFFAVGLVGYGALFSRAGFVATTIVAYALATWVLRRRFTLRSAAASTVIAIVFTLVLHLLFTRVFYVPLPRGTWWTGG